MRISTLLSIPILAACIAVPSRASAQTTVSVGIRLGPAVTVSAYSVQQQGAWQSTYQTWTPVTLYVYQGQYYQEQPRDRHNRGMGRRVSMYQHDNRYFTAPTGRGWAGRNRHTRR